MMTVCKLESSAGAAPGLAQILGSADAGAETSKEVSAACSAAYQVVTMNTQRVRHSYMYSQLAS
eukprot:6209243-Pleurochrysis_carterae.AAC.2